jgi:hypothetical protein
MTFPDEPGYEEPWSASHEGLAAGSPVTQLEQRGDPRIIASRNYWFLAAGSCNWRPTSLASLTASLLLPPFALSSCSTLGFSAPSSLFLPKSPGRW